MCDQRRKPLIETNPHLRDPAKYQEALAANVSSSTAIETGNLKYSNVMLTCRCGNTIGGTVILDKPFSFTCLTCGFQWAGQLGEAEATDE